jgi:hypothetical protein
MTSFDLLSNFNDNPESLVRRVRPHVIITQKILSTQEMNTVDPVDSTSLAPMDLLMKTLEASTNVETAKLWTHT